MPDKYIHCFKAHAKLLSLVYLKAHPSSFFKKKRGLVLEHMHNSFDEAYDQTLSLVSACVTMFRRSFLNHGLKTIQKRDHTSKFFLILKQFSLSNLCLLVPKKLDINFSKEGIVSVVLSIK